MEKGVRICSSFRGFNEDSLWIMTDKKRLQQVLLNLQSNAIKFMRGQGKIDITVSFVSMHSELFKVESEIDSQNNEIYKVDPETDKLIVSVKDSGIGIKHED